MRTYLTFWIAILSSGQAYCQTETEEKPKALQFSGYAEVYYVYDFANPDNHERASFLYNHKRHNEFNINLGFINAAYTTDRVRANLGLMLGTYPQYNLAAEQELLKYIWQANAGVKLSQSKNLWLDAGIFASHIGFESAVSKDCWNLTRSLLAENSPYYESGVKLTYSNDDNRWTFSGLILNGWQRIQRVEGNNTPAFGTQVTFKPNNNTTLNYSTFIGNDQSDSDRKMRYFNNLYAILQLTPKFGLIAGFDIGMQQQEKESHDYDYWYSPVIIARVAINDQLSLAGRVEYYQDKNGVIISTGTPNGFKTFGLSLNLDYKITDAAVLRVEGRTFKSRDDIFEQGDDLKDTNFALATSLAISF